MNTEEIKILIELQEKEEDLNLLRTRIKKLEIEKKILKKRRKG